MFLINVPLGLAAIVGAWRLLPADRPDPSTRLDLMGTVLVCAFSVLLVYPLIQGRELGWPVWTYLSMVAGILLLVGFGWHQRRRDREGKATLVTPSVFGHRGYLGRPDLRDALFRRSRRDAAVLDVVPADWARFHADPRGGLHHPAVGGLGHRCRACPVAVLGPRFGRLVIQGGVVLTGLGWALIVVALRGHGTVGFVDLMPGFLVAGAGLGLVVAPMFDTILASVTDRETGSASGVLNAGQQLATSIGVAVFGTIFFDAVVGGYHHAFRITLAVQVAACAVLLLISPMLPRFAREPQPSGASDPTAPAGLQAAQS